LHETDDGKGYRLPVETTRVSPAPVASVRCSVVAIRCPTDRVAKVYAAFMEITRATRGVDSIRVGINIPKSIDQNVNLPEIHL
jgi:hypothetical protein